MLAQRPVTRLASLSLASVAFALVFLGIVDGESVAHACGAAYPGGPMICTMADAPSARARRSAHELPTARLSTSWAFTSTTILFGDGRRADLTRHSVFAGSEIPISERVGIRFGAGGIVAGTIHPHGERASFGPGATAFFGSALTVIPERAGAPFLQVSGTLSFSRVATRGPLPNEAPSFTALDFRLGGTVGKTIGGVFIPYASLRAFGGPIFYRYAGAAVTGTDLYKYQIGGGFALRLKFVDAFVEGIPLGERGISAGLGITL
jgi:hypothetical protein